MKVAAKVHNDFAGSDKNCLIKSMAGAGHAARSAKTAMNSLFSIYSLVKSVNPNVPWLTDWRVHWVFDLLLALAQAISFSESSYIQSSTRQSCGKCVANSHSNGENNPRIRRVIIFFKNKTPIIHLTINSIKRSDDSHYLHTNDVPSRPDWSSSGWAVQRRRIAISSSLMSSWVSSIPTDWLWFLGELNVKMELT